MRGWHQVRLVSKEEQFGGQALSQGPGLTWKPAFGKGKDSLSSCLHPALGSPKEGLIFPSRGSIKYQEKSNLPELL